MHRWTIPLFLAAACAAMPASAQLHPWTLAARPHASETTLPAGVSRLGNGWAYRPASASGPMPLLVLLHGAGGDARRFLDVARRNADRRGYIVLAPQSAGATWDLVAQRRFGADVKRIDAVLAELFAKAAVDPRRIVVGGFSDGASYALSLGLTNPQLFTGVLALSPGFAVHSEKLDGRQRVFLAHGRSDPVLAFSNVTNRIVPALQAGGIEPRTRWFAGGHRIEPDIYDEGVSHVFALSRELAGGLPARPRTR